VIGLGGVFAINVKHHPNYSIWVGGAFMVNGHQVSYVCTGRRGPPRFVAADQAGRFSWLRRSSIIAVMGANRGFTIKEQPEDGAVLCVAARGSNGSTGSGRSVHPI